MPKSVDKSGRDAQGRLTYEGAVGVLKSGGTVILDGTNHITRIEDLPSEAEFARGDADREAAVLEKLLSLQAHTEAQISLLSGGKAPVKDSGKPAK